jgi:hypothetical protein
MINIPGRIILLCKGIFNNFNDLNKKHSNKSYLDMFSTEIFSVSLVIIFLVSS